MKELSSGVKWLVGVVIVALIGAVITPLVRGCFGPDALGAQLSDVAVDRNVTLDEYAIRHENDSASGPSPAPAMRLEVQLVAQTTPEEPAPEPAPEEPTPEEPTPEEPPPEEPTPEGQTTTDDEGMVLGCSSAPKKRNS